VANRNVVLATVISIATFDVISSIYDTSPSVVVRPLGFLPFTILALSVWLLFQRGEADIDM
jgi:hypothetical protein